MTTTCKKYRHLCDAWNSVRSKLLVYVVEARGLGSASKKGIPKAFAKLKIAAGRVKQEVKTKARQSAEPRGDEPASLVGNVYDSSGRGTPCLGEFKIDMNQENQERLVDVWVELQAVAVKKKRRKQPPQGGQVHLRYYYSALPETRPPQPTSPVYSFGYEGLTFKTGDLLFFGGTGILAASQQVHTGCPWNHVGLVLVLPNKYTKKAETFIAEVGPNIDGLVDPFSETKKQRFTIFRAYERIHQFHGGLIQWAELKTRISSEGNVALSKYIWSAHKDAEALPLNVNAPAVKWVLDTIGNFNIKSSAVELTTASGPSVIAKALSKAGVLDMETADMGALLNCEMFNEPVLIRGVEGIAEAVPPKPKKKERKPSHSSDGTALSGPSADHLRSVSQMVPPGVYGGGGADMTPEQQQQQQQHLMQMQMMGAPMPGGGGSPLGGGSMRSAADWQQQQYLQQVHQQQQLLYLQNQQKQQQQQMMQHQHLMQQQQHMMPPPSLSMSSPSPRHEEPKPLPQPPSGYVVQPVNQSGNDVPPPLPVYDTSYAYPDAGTGAPPPLPSYDSMHDSTMTVANGSYRGQQQQAQAQPQQAQAQPQQAYGGGGASPQPPQGKDLFDAFLPKSAPSKAPPALMYDDGPSSGGSGGGSSSTGSSEESGSESYESSYDESEEDAVASMNTIDLREAAFALQNLEFS